jgi:hypothetical protein
MTAKDISSGTILILSNLAKDFCLTPPLAVSNSLLVRKPISNITPKRLMLAAKPTAAIVATVATVTVATMFFAAYDNPFEIL